MLWVVIGILLKILVVVGIAMGTVAYLIYVERKVAAYAQDRVGPNRGGQGIGHPVRIAPAAGRRRQDGAQGGRDPGLRVKAALSAGADDRDRRRHDRLRGRSVRTGRAQRRSASNFQIAPNINIGILYVFAIGSLAVYGVILAGWASNNKYSFIGGLRSSAQLISYEIPLGMSILGMVLIAGSLDLNQIVNWQDRRVWGVLRPADRVPALSGQRLRRDQPACPSTCPSRSKNWSAVITPSIRR